MEPAGVPHVEAGSADAERRLRGAHPDPDAAENLVGSPRRVAEQIALMRDAGIRNLMLTNRGLMSPEATRRSLKLLAEQVMPKFRDD